MKRILILPVALMLAAGCVTEPDFRDTVSEAKAAVFPALVYIRTVMRNLEEGKNEKMQVSGSGVVISPDGEVLTNHHVIDKATDIRCQLSDGLSCRAHVVGSDKDLDVALLKLELPAGAPPLAFAELSPRRAEIGEVVLAMGAPWGLARSVTMGIISCNDRFLEGAGKYTLWYQTDAAISPGNSGGPLVDTDGKVLGLNARGILFGDQAFTIPSPIILEILGNLRRKGEAGWAWFGIDFQPLNDFERNIVFDADTGVIVAGTEPGGPGRKAGFRPNDRVIAVAGEPVTVRCWEDIPAFERLLGRLDFGSNVTFRVVREGREMDLVAAPTEKGRVEGEEKAFERWGLTVKEINRFDVPDLAFFSPDGGVFVSAVAWDGNADNCEFRRKDVITAIDGESVKTVADVEAVYARALKALPGKYKLSFSLMRKGRPVQLVLNYLTDTEKEEE